MKIKLLLIALSACFFKVRGQIVFSENFTALFSPSANGWFEQNNSVPLGSGTWFQGNSAVFPSYNGGINDFYACNYSSQASSPGGISNFLITPTLNLVNGATLRFFTRTSSPGGPLIFADRLQLLMSQGPGTGAIGSGTSAVGTFTTVLVDINPNLTTTGYPFVWSGFSGTVTGVTGTVVGRFAFRYFVNDGGSSGLNSDYIGIDSVHYVLPCPQSVFSISPTSTAICSGESALLTAITTLTNAPTSYSWSNGQNASSIVVSPLSTTAYTLYAQNSFGCLGSQSITIQVNSKPVITVASSSASFCAGSTVTVSASGAGVYFWSGASSATTSSFTYSSALSGNYSFSVTGTSTTGCSNDASLTVSVISNPTVTAIVSQSIACINNNVTLTASGADSYAWTGPSGSANNPYIFNSGNAPGIKQFTVEGTSNASGCKGSAIVSFTVLSQSVCTNIEEIKGSSLEGEVSVFPNPFTNELRISGLWIRVELYNSLGQLVKKEQVSGFMTLNTSDIVNGVYVLYVKDILWNNSKTVKLVKSQE